ncbi:MAG: nucleotide pyrophosphatase [Okeania sp. SIO2F4]|uniref:alkaline phosphatase family protein n=1 Tax=Okeania sp. SIO2F4 TaxID=2607790 RepID=UPI0014296212|nr:alkaline phosphatase family protein [Okeania sp. SIO2F4]NES04236.1 nucleotide pyrophosphatase [Okeania sp. SIO2F4]
MKNKVIAIGLDAGDPVLIEKWMSQGYLKNLQRFKQQGAYGRLTNMNYYKAETPWTTFLTGCLPEKTGYWAPFKFYEGTYNAEDVQAYDFAEYQPFYALGNDYRVAVFDMPQSALSETANGPQILAWGAHSPQTPSHSLPKSLLRNINNSYGKHPALHRDHGDWWDEAYLTRLRNTLKAGIEKRVAICRDWLQQERWDLFLTIFGETHSAGHDFWYLSQPDHPLYPYKRGNIAASDPMLEIFEEVDGAIGKILADVPDDTYVVVFAAHGSGNNTTDVSSMCLLPEFLYRFNFPGKVMIAPGKVGTPVPPMVLFPKRKTWTGEIWQRKYDPNPVKAFLRSQLPTKFHQYLDRIFGAPKEDLISPEELRKQGHPIFWQPTMWYSPFWPKMKAFAIPSFSEGYIRINLEGREPSGIVSVDEYDALCEQLTQELHQLKNPRTGEFLVKKVVRTREDVGDRNPKLPDADLVVIWAEQPADVVDHPKFGRIGPVPYRRTGSHRGRGFLSVVGPGIKAGSSLPEGHGVDLPATILNLMGVPIPEYMDGKPLVERLVPSLTK